MHDLHPEWGPAKNHPDHLRPASAVQTALDRQDAGGWRPDDN